jgi:hypothetical protein
MTRTQYLQHRRSIRDNGIRYTLANVSVGDSYTLAKLDLLANMQDMLVWRVRWINQPDTTRANIIKLTSSLTA